MKNTISKRVTATIAMVLSMAMLLSMLAVGGLAFDFKVGDVIPGFGTIKTKSETQIRGGDMLYTNYTYTDVKGKGQTAYALEFDPNESGIIPYCYEKYQGWSATTGKAVQYAKAEGLDVVAAVNGELFSMNSKNYGTLLGIEIENGRIMQDCEDRDLVPSKEYPSTPVLAFDKDGKMQLTESKTAYHLYIDGIGELTQGNGAAAIASINKRHTTDNWWDPICYFDSGCGTHTDTVESAPGVEVVCRKLNGGELHIEGTLQAEVVSVNKDTYATSFKPDEFVLYAQNSPKTGYISSFAKTLEGLSVGQKLYIYCEEQYDDAREIMKNANSVMNGTGVMIAGGVNYVDKAKSDLKDEHSQRTMIGVKADGSYVVIVNDGRGTSANWNYGTNMWEMAEVMLSMGCVTAVMLDGGGSSTMVIEDDTVFAGESKPNGRPVANNILFVKRPAVPQDTKDALDAELAYAKGLPRGQFSEKQWQKIQLCIKNGDAVKADVNAMKGEYMHATMDLRMATGRDRNPMEILDYISLESFRWTTAKAEELNIKNEADGSLVLNNTTGMWPAAHNNNINISMNAGKAEVKYDFTVAGATNIILFFRGTKTSTDTYALSISQYITDNRDGEDIKPGTYTGSFKFSDVNLPAKYYDDDGRLTVGAVRIFAVGAAGDGSKVTVRTLDVTESQTWVLGDVNNDGLKNTADVRLILAEDVTPGTLSGDALKSADYNQDTLVNADDARDLLAYIISKV